MSLQFLKDALQSPNTKAMLMTIRKSEGTDAPDGYSYIFGSNPHNQDRFHDFSKHPDIKVPFRDSFSTAAGAYQILFDTWEEIRKKYDFKDFSPPMQDLACCELLSRRNALQLTIDGKFNEVMPKIGHEWASLPFNSYGQNPHPLALVQQWYQNNGGVVSV